MVAFIRILGLLPALETLALIRKYLVVLYVTFLEASVKLGGSDIRGTLLQVREFSV